MLFFGPLGFVGLAVASSMAGWVTALLLISTLVKRGFFSPDIHLITRLLRISFSCGVMGATVWMSVHYPVLQSYVSASNIVYFLFVVVLGVVTYAVSCFGLGAVQFSDIKNAFKADESKD